MKDHRGLVRIGRIDRTLWADIHQDAVALRRVGQVRADGEKVPGYTFRIQSVSDILTCPPGETDLAGSFLQPVTKETSARSG
jgi:hypothetical protein